MNLHHLNSRGFAHHFALALVIVGIITAFTFQAVAGHAQSTYKSAASAKQYSNPYSCPTRPTLSVNTRSSQPLCTRYVQYVVGTKVDGDFFTKTKQAVQKFQFSNRVTGSSCGKSVSTCDGIVGAKTWAKIDEVNAARTKAAQKSDPAKCAAARPVVKPGQKGNCIAKVQKLFGTTVTGSYDKSTYSAVTALQKSYNFKKVDGITTPCTWHAFYGEKLQQGCAKPTPAKPIARLSGTCDTRLHEPTPPGESNSGEYFIGFVTVRNTGTVSFTPDLSVTYKSKTTTEGPSKMFYDYTSGITPEIKPGGSLTYIKTFNIFRPSGDQVLFESSEPAFSCKAN